MASPNPCSAKLEVMTINYANFVRGSYRAGGSNLLLVRPKASFRSLFASNLLAISILASYLAKLQYLLDQLKS